MEISDVELVFVARSLAEVLFAAVNVQAVVSPDSIVPSPCLSSIFKPQQGRRMPAVTEEGPVGRSRGVWYSPEPPCTAAALPLFADC